MEDCIKWDGATRKDGRGFIRVGKKLFDSHKFVYEQHYGKVPKGICVRRKCKNFECVNLNHLYLEPKCIPVKERFFKNVFIPENENLCWLWTGKKDKDGYGQIDGKREFNEKRAHRISYLLNIGKIENKMIICHSCDNPSCVNPKHIWAGSYKDNNQDAFLKNRRIHQKPPIFYGKDNNKTKLSIEQVLQIRKLNEDGESYSSLGRKFNVSNNNVREICLRKTWKHI